ncbi:MAG TPA: hypothetical protein PLV25_08165, partial [Opitutales bacterium]|nr:hypothetical protein [Opitutales bacterium]
GIELFCKVALPTLLVIAFVLVVRVLTLGTPTTGSAEASISTGLGFMWNPEKVMLEIQAPSMNEAQPAWIKVREVVGSEMMAQALAEIDDSAKGSLRLRTITLWEQLSKPRLWLAAASQIFFSLSVGFGLIATYASYLKKKDDIVLSSLSAAGANEFSEVALGGLLTIPAAVAFLGIGALAGQTSLFSLGFQALPMVFAQMPGGDFFGFLFFMLLFLASVSGCLSTLQPGIAFLEEALPTIRKQSIAILGFVVAIGAFMVFYFSEGVKALDTLDFWVGSFLIFIMATTYSIMFGWVMPLDNAWVEAHEGSALKIPRIFRPIIKYLCPIFLLAIFACWMGYNLFS